MKTKIKIKKYVEDAALTWEQRYDQLMKHHVEETGFLIKVIEELEQIIDDADLRPDS